MMNRIELKKILNRYNSICNRLLQSDPDDYIKDLKRFITFLDSTEVIGEYIKLCGESELDMESEFNRVLNSHGEFTFSTGDTDEEEVRNVYAALKYLSQNYDKVPLSLYHTYSNGSSHYSDMLKEFNSRFTMVLIRHIENYLKEVGIEMGLDENVTYNINGNMVNIANDNANINATQNNNGINADELKSLIAAMRENLESTLSEEDKAEATECINAIEAELLSPQPNETTVKDKFKLLKRIDKSAKFLSTCCSLLTFADKIYPFLADIVPAFQALIP